MSSTGEMDPELTDVFLDPANVSAGALFCCIQGSRRDGHDLAGLAARRGAVALLCERHLDVGLPQLVVSSAREALACASVFVYGQPATKLRVVGITGTNGKTTTAAFVESILRADGMEPLLIGTLSGARTTPDAADLQRQLASAVASGKKSVVMEVSSHALVQHRVDAMRFDVSVFTNLSRDHLDYHGTMEAYFEAKAMLFDAARTTMSVINIDDEYGRRLAERQNDRYPSNNAKSPTMSQFGIADAEELKVGVTGAEFRWKGFAMRTHVAGGFNVMNALAAITASSALDIAPEAAAVGLAALEGVPGRFEVVASSHPAIVVVDYAHTPDGLERLLIDARKLVKLDGSLVVVFGCGGDRDTGKRPQMGAVAVARADVVIVTSDNPRSEDPRQIIDDILTGIATPSSALVISDRRQAIAQALEDAKEGDVVVVAGKGHERTQDICGVLTDFDDRQVIVELARQMAQA